jgi:uncharacterized protein YaaN involved in tellurite resistance
MGNVIVTIQELQDSQQMVMSDIMATRASQERIKSKMEATIKDWPRRN